MVNVEMVVSPPGTIRICAPGLAESIVPKNRFVPVGVVAPAVSAPVAWVILCAYRWRGSVIQDVEEVARPVDERVRRRVYIRREISNRPDNS